MLDISYFPEKLNENFKNLKFYKKITSSHITKTLMQTSLKFTQKNYRIWFWLSHDKKKVHSHIL